MSSFGNVQISLLSLRVVWCHSDFVIVFSSKHRHQIMNVFKTCFCQIFEFDFSRSLIGSFRQSCNAALLCSIIDFLINMWIFVIVLSQPLLANRSAKNADERGQNVLWERTLPSLFYLFQIKRYLEMVEQKFEAKKLEMIFFIFVFGKTMVTEKRSKVKNQRNKTFNRIWWHEFVPFCSTSHKKKHW